MRHSVPLAVAPATVAAPPSVSANPRPDRIEDSGTAINYRRRSDSDSPFTNVVGLASSICAGSSQVIASKIVLQGK